MLPSAFKFFPELTRMSIGHSRALIDLNDAVISLMVIVHSLYEEAAPSLTEERRNSIQKEFEAAMAALRKAADDTAGV